MAITLTKQSRESARQALESQVVQEILDYMEQTAFNSAVNSPNDKDAQLDALDRVRNVRNFRSQLMFIVTSTPDERK